MVYILLAPGFEEAEALVPADLLRRAGLETKLIGLTAAPVPGGQGMQVVPDGTLDQVDLDRADMIVLPGGSLGVKNLGAEPAVEALVRRAAQRGIWVAAICAAPTLLAQWDLLHGKRAVCYPGLEPRLGDAQPQDFSVVEAGNIITGRAAGSAFDFGLKLVSVLSNTEKSEEVRHGICYY
jgi:protein deglycase